MKRTAQPGDGNIYVKDGKLSLWYYTAEKDEEGRWKREWLSTGLDPGQEKLARVALEQIRQQVLEELRTGMSVGPLTLLRYGNGWFKARESKGVGSVKDERTRFKHAKPLHDILLSDLRPRHFRDLLADLRARIGPEKEDMSPRQVRHIYFLLRQMLSDAVADELIPTTPCVVKQDEIPEKRDKNPFWRKTAVFKVTEVEALISDERIPEERRTLYGLLFLGGKRIGEVSALDVEDYDATQEPLGALRISQSFNRKKRELKGTKTDNPREVPVHPALAKLLGAWLVGGRERYTGEPTRPGSILIPSGKGNRLRDPTVLQNLHRDLRNLGLRPRRTHDTRRTLISMARDAHADLKLLKWITHGPSGDIMDDYYTPSWEALCAEIAKIRVNLKEGRIVQLRKVSGASCGDVCDDDSEGQGMLNDAELLEAYNAVPRAGFEPAFKGRGAQSRGRKRAEQLDGPERQSSHSSPTRPDIVTTSQLDRRRIAEKLQAALIAWSEGEPSTELRDRLAAILSLLPEGGG